MRDTHRPSPHRCASRRLAAVVLGLLLAGPAGAQQSFEEWLQQDQKAFQDYSEQVTREYRAFYEQDKAAFEKFVREAAARWGKQNVWVPEKKVWVQYARDFEERSRVDFEQGAVRVQVLLAPDETLEAGRRRLGAAVQHAVLSGTEDPVQMVREADPAATEIYVVKKGDTLWGVAKRFKVSRKQLARLNGVSPDSWLKIGQRLRIPRRPGPAPAPPKPKPAAPTPAAVPAPGPGPKPPAPPAAPATHQAVLAGQVRTADGAVVTRANAETFSRKLVDERAPTPSAVTGEDGTERRMLAVRFRLVPDHLRIRAERYRPLVLRYAAEYKVYPPLVFAIMQTESSFNPRARSGVPAFGLMQLVPHSGGRDAYRLVYGRDKLVRPAFLYQPENNIRLGIAYLHILGDRYLKPIEDPVNRMYCTIAAYNTGAGNVSRAFSPGTSVRRAAVLINTMPPTQVYAGLRKKLPYAETRNYLKKVRERMPLYRNWR